MFAPPTPSCCAPRAPRHRGKAILHTCAESISKIALKTFRSINNNKINALCWGNQGLNFLNTVRCSASCALGQMLGRRVRILFLVRSIFALCTCTCHCSCLQKPFYKEHIAIYLHTFVYYIRYSHFILDGIQINVLNYAVWLKLNFTKNIKNNTIFMCK